VILPRGRAAVQAGGPRGRRRPVAPPLYLRSPAR